MTETTTTPKATARRTAKPDSPATDAATTADAAVLNGARTGDKPATKPATRKASTAPEALKAAKPGPQAPAKAQPKAAAKPAPATPKPAPVVKAKAEPAPKPDIRGAKQDLARRVAQAVADMVNSADGSEAYRAVMTTAEALECASSWIHHIPAGRENGEGSQRWWPADLPRPNRSDWR